MNRTVFFASLRAALGTTFSKSQVAGIEVLLDNAAPDMPVDRLAYCLGTAWHETAETMQPIHERGARKYFDKYEPGTVIGKRLGNTKKGDGYLFRGRGFVQLTGRDNYKRAGAKVNVDLIREPDRALAPATAAKILYVGMADGWFTTKDLDDYLDGIDESDAEDLREFTAARKIVNGTDKAETIGWYAIAFEKALRQGKWGVVPASQPPAPEFADPTVQQEWDQAIPADPPAHPEPAPAPAPSGFWAWLRSLFS